MATDEAAAPTDPGASESGPGPDLEAAPAGPAEALPQDAPVAPADLEAQQQDQDELDAKGLDAWTPPDPLPPELKQRVEALAPQPPQGLQDADRERWAMSATVATMIAIDQFDGEPDVELRKFAWSTARSIFGDPKTFPMDEPPVAAPAVVPASEPAGTPSA